MKKHHRTSYTEAVLAGLAVLLLAVATFLGEKEDLDKESFAVPQIIEVTK